MLAHFYDRCESAGATSLIAAAREAIAANEIECLALCLSNAQEQQLKKAAPSLLKVAVDENAAECALALLNYVDEVRRRSWSLRSSSSLHWTTLLRPVSLAS